MPMPAEVIECPSCRHPVRVPESLFGQPVRCPECKAYFTAPVRDAAGNMGRPELLTDAPAPTVAPAPTQRPLAGQSPLFVPALCLLLVGLIGTAVNGYQAAQWFIDKDAAERDRFARLEQVGKLINRPIDEAQAKQVVQVQRPTETVVAVLSILPILGALAMLWLRGWALAVIGSGVAIINFGNCCCLIGLPTGIYCLVKLFDPQIRPLFRQSP
jgi:hypothetical protein